MFDQALQDLLSTMNHISRNSIGGGRGNEKSSSCIRSRLCNSNSGMKLFLSISDYMSIVGNIRTSTSIDTGGEGGGRH